MFLSVLPGNTGSAADGKFSLIFVANCYKNRSQIFPYANEIDKVAQNVKIQVKIISVIGKNSENGDWNVEKWSKMQMQKRLPEKWEGVRVCCMLVCVQKELQQIKYK